MKFSFFTIIIILSVSTILIGSPFGLINIRKINERVLQINSTFTEDFKNCTKLKNSSKNISTCNHYQKNCIFNKNDTEGQSCINKQVNSSDSISNQLTCFNINSSIGNIIKCSNFFTNCSIISQLKSMCETINLTPIANLRLRQTQINEKCVNYIARARYFNNTKNTACESNLNQLQCRVAKYRYLIANSWKNRYCRSCTKATQAINITAQIKYRDCQNTTNQCGVSTKKYMTAVQNQKEVCPNYIYKTNRVFDKEMLWGTYKPQLIHAVTQRRLDTYNPITISLMYFNQGSINKAQDMFYKIPERISDSIRYDVTHQDGSTLQVQDVTDPQVDFKFRTSFIKINQVEFIDEIRNLKLTTGNIQLVYTFALEQNNPKLADTRIVKVDPYLDGYLIQVEDSKNKTSNFYISYRQDGNQKQSTKPQIAQLSLSYEDNWDPRQQIYEFIKGDSRLVTLTPNVVAFIFNFPKSIKFSIQIQHYQDINFFGFLSNFASVIRKEQNRLEQEFKQIYYVDKSKINPSDFSCAFNSYSSLMSGLQFSYGNLHCVQDSQNCREEKGMLSHTPSRFGFPRPFLWDEGFHNQISCWLRPHICLQSLTNWINTMSKDGWIPREQPRGTELRSYIPGLKEDPKETNPPTFFFNFELLLKNFPDDEQIKSRIGDLYPKLRLWYESWFRTQSTRDQNGMFTGYMKWWGPSEHNNLGSGMDDWPRSKGNQFSKYNVDAQAWGIFLSQKMLELTQIYNNQDQVFQDLINYRIDLVKQKLNTELLDPNDNLFKDILYDQWDKDRKSIYSPHLGYPNLLPLAMGLIDPKDHKLVNAQIRLMSDPATIWTEYGLRSLSVSDEDFGTSWNYWRGPIWININYLILRGIKLHYSENQEAKDFYIKLRSAIMKTVCGNYHQYGFFFEHYNQNLDGRGVGQHPFNGWTSTISLIVTEKY